MFISKTKRGVSATSTAATNKGKDKQQAVLQYDVDSKTIGAQVKKKVETISNPILASLAKKTQSGFSSIAPRWNNNQSDEAQAFIGPGYYE